MATGAQRRRPVLIFILALILGVVVFAVTETAYTAVDEGALPGYQSVGAVALAMDINSYYSFIHQAAQGNFLFRNNMTHEPCDEVFINLQWWAVGRAMDLFSLTPQRVFVIWRIIGSVALMLGFAALAWVGLPRTYQQVAALLMCAFGSGFGWVVAIPGSFQLIDTTSTFGLRNPAMDLITAIHPFGQILKNPHYSLPHGTFLIFLALFMLGEQSGRPRWYAASALVAILQGLFRPYDTITICAMIPAFIAVESIVTRSIDVKRASLRALPLLVSLPLLTYYFYIFSIHPVFTYWAEQGKQPPASFLWHTMGLGLAGVLFVYRLVRVKKFPLSTSWERSLVVLVFTMLFLYHGNHLTRLLSFSPQIGIPLVPPMIILGLAMAPALAERFRAWHPSVRATALAAFLFVNAIGSPLYVIWNAKIGTIEPRNYLRAEDLEAIEWLKKNAEPGDIVLSSELMGSRIAYLSPIRVALGHWALTPNVKALKKKFERFEEGDMPVKKAKEFISEINPRFIYITDPAEAARPVFFRKTANAERVFENQFVAIYEVGNAKRSSLAARQG